MARAPKAKPLAHAAVTRTGSTYQIQVEDEAGKKVLYELTSDLAIRLADQLDDLLAEEEEEMRPPSAPAPAPTPAPAPASAQPGRGGPAPQRDAAEPPPGPEREGSGTVKWYNATKGFGFITPDEGGEEVFLHRTVLEQSGLSGVTEGMRVRIGIVDGKKGPQVCRIEIA
ncbi:MAG TPA: cold-shock protein [Microvirga sp.]|nr:cold-shock protein [Microvirga sp.]